MKTRMECQLLEVDLEEMSILNRVSEVLREAKALGYQKIDLKLKAYETVETVVPEGQMHLIAFAKDDWEVVQLIVKKNVLGLKKTARTQQELNEFFDYKGETK